MISTPAGGSDPTLSETRIAHAVIAAARSLSSVAGVSPGLFVEAATYGPRETVRGVVVRRLSGALSIELHLRARYSPSLVLPVLADRLRDAVRQTVRTLSAEPIQRIDVAFDDLHVGEE